MDKVIKVIHQGLGPIGLGTAKLVLKDPKFQIIGATDVNPKLIGKDLGNLLGVHKLGIKVTDNIKSLFTKKPDVVVLTTCSKLEKIVPSLKVAISNGTNVVSPAEELFYPQFISKEKTHYIDKLAKENNVRILGRGVNPGCLMDTYPLNVYRKGNFSNLKSIIVYRWDDTIERRMPLLKKTGTGLSKEEFYELNRKGKLGHVGLRMSAAYLADNIGISNYKIKFKREPMIAKSIIKPKHREEIAAGKVIGLHENCKIIADGQEIIILDLKMYVGARKRNSVIINGIETDYSNIVNGDIATLRILKDSIKHVINGQPGLNTVEYIPDPNKILKTA